MDESDSGAYSSLSIELIGVGAHQIFSALGGMKADKRLQKLHLTTHSHYG